ncbi:SPOR domain-containing protein, partial [Sphingomonas sp. Leaf10]|uniref:SPOR domain-containing protein n=1 Tax=Sphingomonas sp. Leaf10 TaxID=1735676 RepID=UPI00138F041D
PALPTPPTSVAKTPPAPTPPAPKSVAAPPAPVASGSWRVQLGAFRDAGNARRLWGDVAARFAGRQPFYDDAGGVTRLQIGPFASSAEASRACAAIRPTTCVPVRR